jgi:hypothetical protein
VLFARVGPRKRLRDDRLPVFVSFCPYYTANREYCKAQLGEASRAVLNCLCQVSLTNLARTCQISHGTRQLQDPVVCPGREVELIHRSPEHAVAGGIQGAELSDLGWTHVRVAEQRRSALTGQPAGKGREPLPLNTPGGLHSGTHRAAALS